MGPGCDIYALGVILYQILTGRLPFEGAIADVLGQIVSQPPAPLSHYRPGLDPRLEAICLKALSKTVTDRYSTMHDLGAALADYLRCHSAPAAIPVHQASPARTPANGRKLLWLVLAGAAFAAVSGTAAILLVGVLFWFSNSPGSIRLELDGPRAKAEVQVDGERIDSTRLNEALQLRPGKHHLLVTGKNIQPVNTSFTVARGDNAPLRVKLVPVPEPPSNPTPTPVGSRPRSDDDRKERKEDRKERKGRDDD
jgi:hypothetical protein